MSQRNIFIFSPGNMCEDIDYVIIWDSSEMEHIEV